MIAADESQATDGNVFSCASGSDPCAVTVAADETTSSTGCIITANLTQAVEDILASRSMRKPELRSGRPRTQTMRRQ